MDSPFLDRNPTPPRELFEQHADLVFADNVGETSFSKQTIFAILMKLIQCVDKESKSVPSPDRVVTSSSSSPVSRDTELPAETDNSAHGVDIDEDLQNDLCLLWDMSTDQDVCKFLHDYKSLNVLTNIIACTKAPRVAEICTGIIANMFCVSQICQVVNEDPEFIDLFVLLLDGRDGPTLNEVVRLLHTCICHESAATPVLKSLRSTSDILTNLIFILSSSTNTCLLKNVGELVDKVLDVEPAVVDEWGTTDMVNALLEGMQQLRSVGEPLDAYMHILQLLSTTDSSVDALVANAERVQTTLQKYLDVICEYDVVCVDGIEATLASVLAVFNILFSSSRDVATDCLESEKFMHCLLKIIESLPPTSKQTNKTSALLPDSCREGPSNQGETKSSPSTPPRNDEPSCTDDSQGGVSASGDCLESVKTLDGTVVDRSIDRNGDVQEKSRDGDGVSQLIEDSRTMSDLSTLYDILQGFSVDIVSVIPTSSEKEVDEKPSPHPLLVYMDSRCNRERLNRFFQLLVEDRRGDLLEKLARECRLGHLSRLESVISRSTLSSGETNSAV